MKVFKSLNRIDNTWVLRYTEDAVNKEYTTTDLGNIKVKCIEYNFHLDFTGELNVGNQ